MGFAVGDMNVLLTKARAASAAGSRKTCSERGDRVWIYDLKEDPKRMALIMDEAQVRQVAFVQGDVTDALRLKETLARHQITHVIHLAGLQVPVT